jgi:hypothetical protein
MHQLTGTFVATPRGWTGAELAGRPSAWTHHLTDEEVAELDALATGGPASTPALTAAAAAWVEEVRAGRGFVAIRGLPVDRWSVDEARAAFLGLGRLVGSPMGQNAAGDLVADVRAERDVADPSARRYETAEETPFHTDGSDMIALLCLRQGQSGGQSAITSSVNVVNAVAERRPDLLPLLSEPWPFAMTKDATEHFELPLLASLEPFSFFYIRWYIEQSQAVDAAPRLTDAHIELLDLVDEAAAAGRLDIEFAPGDIQLLSNRVVMHARTTFVDWDEPERRRHLLRLWLGHHGAG